MDLHPVMALAAALACWAGVLAWRHRTNIDAALRFACVVAMVLMAFLMNLAETIT